jgi:two-component system OmpR family sensor kinase
MLAQIENAFGRAQASEAAARESEARMRRFVADASHELRTPLTSIRGFAELYRVGALDDDEAVSRAMGRIEAEASRMGLLVEDLLLLARMDRQRQLAAVPVDLPELAGDTVHDARAASPDRDIRLEVTGGEAPWWSATSPACGPCSSTVSNAVRYSPDGAGRGARGIRPSPDGAASWAVVEVVDRGPGLEPDAAARVFERFYRTDDARDRDAGSTGLRAGDRVLGGGLAPGPCRSSTRPPARDRPSGSSCRWPEGGLQQRRPLGPRRPPRGG